MTGFWIQTTVSDAVGKLTWPWLGHIALAVLSNSRVEKEEDHNMDHGQTQDTCTKPKRDYMPMFNNELKVAKNDDDEDIGSLLKIIFQIFISLVREKCGKYTLYLIMDVKKV